jgi:hypothetical protein
MSQPSGSGFFSGNSAQSFGQYDPYASRGRDSSNSQYASPLPSGGVYGAQKWSSSQGSNAVDIFVPRGTPVTAPVSGTLQPGQNGQLILIGDNGLSFAFRHGRTTAQGHVQRGQQIGVVDDPGLDMLGRAPWGDLPDNYQHLEMSVSNGNYFPATPGGGGSIDAAQWLDSIGYQGRKIGRTPGPPDAQGGGMGMGGFGIGSPIGSPFGGAGSVPGNPFGGMPPGFGGMPGAGGMGRGGPPGAGGPPGMGPGMPPGFGMGIPGMSPGGPNPYMSALGMQPPGGNPFMGAGMSPGFSGGFSPGMPPMMPPPMMARPPMAPPMNLPSFAGFGAGPSPMAMGLGNPFSFAGGGGPAAAAGMMLNPFGGPGPAGAASMYGA